MAWDGLAVVDTAVDALVRVRCLVGAQVEVAMATVEVTAVNAVVAAMADVLVVATVTVVAAVAASAGSAVQWVLVEVPVVQGDSAARVAMDSVLQIAAGKHKYYYRFHR